MSHISDLGQLSAVGREHPDLPVAGTCVLVDEDQPLRIRGAVERRGSGPIDVVGVAESVIGVVDMSLDFRDRKTGTGRVERASREIQHEIKREQSGVIVAQHGLCGVAGAGVDVFQLE